MAGECPGERHSGDTRRLAHVSLFALLDEVSWATVDLPAPDEVVYNAEDKDKSEDGTGPVLRRRCIVSFTFRRAFD